MEAFNVPDFSTIFGFVLTLCGLALGLVAVPLTRSRQEFNIARLCFALAALVFLAKLVVWGADGGMGAFRIVSVGVLGAVLAISLTLSLRWVSEQEAHKHATTEATVTALEQTRPDPPSSQVFIDHSSLDFTVGISCLRTGQPTFLREERPIQTLQVVGHPEPGKDPAFYLGTIDLPQGSGNAPKLHEQDVLGVRCAVTNYGLVDITSLVINVFVRWIEVLPTEHGITSGKEVASTMVTLTRFSLGERGNQADFFYVYNASNVYVSVIMPSEALVRIAGRGELQKVKLIPADTVPQREALLSPINLKNHLAAARLAPVQPKPPAGRSQR